MKVTFALDPAAWHGHASERLWAEDLGGNRYRLRNSPFYAYGVSFHDVVLAEFDRDGHLIFGSVLLSGGHSTYRLVLNVSAEESAFKEHWQPMEAIGCSLEGADRKLLSIDIPPEVDIKKAYALLEAGENDGIWGFEEGHCGHLVTPSTAETT